MKLYDLTVLLVEPSDIQSRIITDYLHEVGVTRCQGVHTGAAALEILHQQDVHLVISAMHLPDMTGRDLIQAMDHIDRPVRPTFLLASSETSPALMEPVRQAGPAAMLPKPFNSGDLREALRVVIDYLEPGVLHLRDQEPEDLRVLLVDDSTPARRFVRKLLAEMGLAHFTEADDGATAIPLIREQFFDLIITDYNMPQMDGLELLRFIRKESDQASAPVVMISSETDPGRLAAIHAAGVSALCPKPFDVALLKNLLQNLLNEG